MVVNHPITERGSFGYADGMILSKLILPVVLGALAIGAGCKPSNDASSDSLATSAQRQADRTQDAIAEAARDFKAYTYEQKEQFIASMEKELVAIENNIEELGRTVQRTTGDTKAAAEDRLKKLRSQAGLLKSNINDVKNANASTWEQVKNNTHEIYENVKSSLNDARQWVSDTVAP